MNKFKTAFAATLLTVVGATSAAASVMTYTDRTSFETALLTARPGQTLVVEDFSGNTFGPEILGLAGSNVMVENERLEDQANDGVGNPSTFITLNMFYNGFGGDFDLSPGGAGSGLVLTAWLSGGGMESVSLPTNNYVGFFGFISTTGFNVVTVSEHIDVGVETYNLDNITMGVVPLPAPAFLLLGALGGLALVRRKSA
jgi:hypothetical protein